MSGYARHQNGQLPDFGLARQVFDGGRILEDELERAATHAEEEEREKPGPTIMSTSLHLVPWKALHG